MLTPLRRHLRASVERAGAGRHVEAAQVLATCRAILDREVDPAIAERTRPAVYRHGVVVLRVGSAYVAQELLPLIPALTDKLRAAYPHLPVTQVVTRVGR